MALERVLFLELGFSRIAISPSGTLEQELGTNLFTPILHLRHGVDLFLHSLAFRLRHHSVR